MSAPRKTRRQLADEKMCRNAVTACRWAESAHDGKRPFSINALPDDECRAAHALLYAAISHSLCAQGKGVPKTMRWQGRRWHLNAVGKGRIEVSAYPGYPGIVSMPGVLL